MGVAINLKMHSCTGVTACKLSVLQVLALEPEHYFRLARDVNMLCVLKDAVNRCDKIIMLSSFR